MKHTEDSELIALFADLDTPSISDALDKRGIRGQCFGISPLDDYAHPIVGTAFTVHYVTTSVSPGTVGDFLDDVEPGEIVVIDNDGRTDCTVWGDIMTGYAEAKGVSGTVIDGVCRDVSKALGDGYPLFSRGRFMRTGKDRVQVASVNEPVSIGQARVQSRDIVIGDANGVVVVPRSLAHEIADIARQVEAVEAQIRECLRGGLSLHEARAKLGYHALQRKQAQP